jgi:hypothetical protein
MKFAWLSLMLLGLPSIAARADDIPELKAIEAHYDQAKLATDESLREKYILELAQLRFHFSHSGSDAWMQVDAEIKRHPAPANSNSEAFRKLRLGIWYSPRHAYRFKADGTWVMGLDKDPDATHGYWAIKGNQYIDDIQPLDKDSTKYVIILLTADNFIYDDPSGSGPSLYYERRSETGGMPIMRDDPAPPIPPQQPTVSK